MKSAARREGRGGKIAVAELREFHFALPDRFALRPTSLHHHSLVARNSHCSRPGSAPPPLPAGFLREDGPRKEIRKITGKKLFGSFRTVYFVLKFSAASACPEAPVPGSSIATIADIGYRRRRDKKLFAKKIMDTDLPGLVAAGKVPILFEKIQSAGVPEKFTYEFLKKLGLSSSNDRAFPSYLKRLGFIDGSGVPTARYKAYRQKSKSAKILGEALRELYAELFSVDEKIHKGNREHIQDVISRVTGLDESPVKRMTATFVHTAKLADLDSKPEDVDEEVEEGDTKDAKGSGTIEQQEPTKQPQSQPNTHTAPSSLVFRHNIEVHLPATTDIGVYNAIFKSLKEHLLE